MGFDNPENPTIIEDFIKALGATPVVYPYRNECCGGYVTMEDEALPRKKVAQINESAKGMGAEMLITACPFVCTTLTTTVKTAFRSNISPKFLPRLSA